MMRFMKWATVLFALLYAIALLLLAILADLIARRAARLTRPFELPARWGRMKNALLALALLSVAACDRGGAVKEDLKPTPPLDQMVEEPGDWTGLTPAIGQTPNESALLTRGPLPVDLNALLGEHAVDFRRRMNAKAGPLHEEAGLLVSMTPPGPEAAYLVVDAADHAMEAGRNTAEGWKTVRTPAAEFALPPSVASLKAGG